MKITQLPIRTPLRDRPGYIKEPRTNPEVLARGARGQHRAALRRALREAGSLFPHNRKARRARGLDEVSQWSRRAREHYAVAR